MNWLDRIYTRRLHRPPADVVPARWRRRLRIACCQLGDAEEAVQRRMGLCARPRLALVDEEMAVIIPPALRDEIQAEQGGCTEP